MARKAKREAVEQAEPIAAPARDSDCPSAPDAVPPTSAPRPNQRRDSRLSPNRGSPRKRPAEETSESLIQARQQFAQEADQCLQEVRQQAQTVMQELREVRQDFHEAGQVLVDEVRQELQDLRQQSQEAKQLLANLYQECVAAQRQLLGLRDESQEAQLRLEAVRIECQVAEQQLNDVRHESQAAEEQLQAVRQEIRVYKEDLQDARHDLVETERELQESQDAVRGAEQTVRAELPPTAEERAAEQPPETKGRLGATVEMAEGVVQVAAVLPGTPAERAGLQRGDVIRRINDREVVQAEDLREAADGAAAGEDITLQVARGAEVRVIPVRLDEEPMTVDLSFRVQ
jgi:hypothetical protein